MTSFGADREVMHLIWGRTKRHKNPFRMEEGKTDRTNQHVRSVLLPVCALGVLLFLFLHMTGQIENGWLIVFLTGIFTIIYQLVAQFGKKAAGFRRNVFLLLPLVILAFPGPRRAVFYELSLFGESMKNCGRVFEVSEGLEHLLAGEISSIADSVPDIASQLLSVLAFALWGIVLFCYIQRVREGILVWLAAGTVCIFLLFVGVWPGVPAVGFLLVLLTVYMTGSVPAAAVCILAATLVFSFYSMGGSLSEEQVSAMKRRWNGWRYHSQQQVLPNGDIRKATSLERDTKKVDLKVSMTKKEVVYLRGFTGTVFQKDRWSMDSKRLRTMEMAKRLAIDEGSSVMTTSGNGWISVLNLLHRRSFYGLGQLAMAEEETARKKNWLKYSPVTYTVDNLDADRSQIYLPYEVKSEWLDQQEVAAVGSGEMLTARGLTGQNHYEIQGLSSLMGKVQTMDLQGEDSNLYGQYVEATCTSLPRRLREYFAETLNARTEMDSILTIISRVRTHLKKNMTYERHPGKIPDDGDFILWFFEQNRKGYDVHYATAAVMMFRYYGIPSRYVEGYILPGQLLDKNPDETVYLTESYAHAWPEIYVEHAGWIPVEVVERYEDLMPSYYEANPILLEQADAIGKSQEEKEGTEEDTSQEVDTSQQEGTAQQQGADQQQDTRQQQEAGQQQNTSRQPAEKVQPEEEEPDFAQILQEGLDKETGSEKKNRWYLYILPVILALILVRLYLRNLIYVIRMNHYQTRKQNNKAVILAYDRMMSSLAGLERYQLAKTPGKRTVRRPGDNRMHMVRKRIRIGDRAARTAQIRKHLKVRQAALYGFGEVNTRDMAEAIRFFDRETGVFRKKIPWIRRLFGALYPGRKVRKYVDS